MHWNKQPASAVASNHYCASAVVSRHTALVAHLIICTTPASCHSPILFECTAQPKLHFTAAQSTLTPVCNFRALTPVCNLLILQPAGGHGAISDTASSASSCSSRKSVRQYCDPRFRSCTHNKHGINSQHTSATTCAATHR